MNGAGFSAIFWGSTSLNLLVERLLLIFYMIVLYLLFTFIRAKNTNQRSLCIQCEEQNSPVCTGFRIQAQVEEKIDEYTIKLLNKNKSLIQ